MRLLILVAVWILHRGARLELSSWFDDRAAAGLRAVSRGRLAGWLGADAVTLLVMTVPTAVLGLLLMMIAERHPALRAFVDFALLTLALGCNRLRLATDAYLEDERSRRWPHAREALAAAGVSVRRQWISVEARHKDVCSQILALNLQRYFVVIFWFMAGGGAAALLVRLALNNEVRAGTGLRLRLALEWLPLRLFAGSAALLGNRAGMTVLAERLWQWWPGALPALSLALVRRLYDQAAAQPGGHPAHPLSGEIRLLLSKILLLWLILLALATLVASWA